MIKELESRSSLLILGRPDLTPPSIRMMEKEIGQKIGPIKIAKAPFRFSSVIRLSDDSPFDRLDKELGSYQHGVFAMQVNDENGLLAARVVAVMGKRLGVYSIAAFAGNDSLPRIYNFTRECLCAQD